MAKEYSELVDDKNPTLKPLVKIPVDEGVLDDIEDKCRRCKKEWPPISYK